MNFFKTPTYQLKKILLISIISVSILSCGAESLVIAGISGTGIVFGAITGFGSVYVNDVKYDVDNATFDVDGDLTADQNKLKIGMLVKLIITEYDDGSFAASSVVYDDSIEGPILISPEISLDGNEKAFEILGVSVVVNKLTTNFDGMSFEELKVRDVIEVSGLIDPDGKILATMIQKKGNAMSGSTRVEMHGQISDLNENVSFTMNGVTFFYGSSTKLDDLPDGLINGLFVEVEGIYNEQSNIITVKKVEGEDKDRHDIINSQGSLSIEGYISEFKNVNSPFVIGLIPVRLDTSFIPDATLVQLANGVQVEVSGVMKNKMLLVQSIDIEDAEDDDDDDD